MATDKEVDIDDLDLDVDPAEEIRRLAAISDKEDAESTNSDAPEASDTDEKPQVTTNNTPAEAVESGKDVLRELQAEKERLQQRLIELEVRTKINDERLERLAQQQNEIGQAQQAEEVEGPTAEEILEYIDQQRSAIEDQIEQARQASPDVVPQLRNQLRQLNRYYEHFKDQQRALEIQQVLAQGQIDPNAVVEELQYRQRYESIRSAIFQEYPVLDKNNPAYNKDFAKEISDIYLPQIEKGKDPIDTLTRATVLVMRAHGILSASEVAALERQKAKEKEKGKDTQRKTEAVKRNVAASNAQPPNISGMGKANEPAVTYDFDNMSDEEFDKLVASEKSLLERLSMYDG